MSNQQISSSKGIISSRSASLANNLTEQTISAADNFIIPMLRKPPPQVQFEWPFPNFKHSQKLWKIKSAITVTIVGISGRIVMNWMNRSKVYNEDIMLNAIFNRPAGTPLITVSNHESCCDDPMVLSKFFKPRQFMISKMRWSLAAHDICFSEPWHGKMFSLGKCIPTVRGHGVYQKAMDFAIDRLNHSGDWLHVFPEGRINMEREQLYRLKWGIGRIISECKAKPIIIPLWHTGMADVLPNYPPYYPRFNNQVVINVGQPLDLTEVLRSINTLTPLKKRKIITDFIENVLIKLREETLQLRNDLVKSKK